MKASIGFFVLVLPFLSACATIVSGTDQNISVESNVKGANVYYTGNLVGLTPFFGRVKKDRNPTLLVTKKGYDSRQQILSTNTPITFWGNILTGGFVGSTTDYVSGAMFEVTPANYYINLEPVAAAEPEDDAPAAPKKTKKAPAKDTNYNYREDTELKRFTMINYRALSNDLARGDGEYLNTLTKMLSLRPEQRSAVVAKLQQIAKTSDSPIHFGESVAAYYYKEIKI